MAACKFEITIGSTGRFHCAADVNGWAYLWTHEEFESPCVGCKKRRDGEPTKVEHELKSAEFWQVAGNIITEKDWDHLNAVKHTRKDET